MNKRTCRTRRPRCRNNDTLEQRMLRYVRQGLPDECWLWTGSVGKAGYGQMTYQGKHYNTHRLAFMLWCGPIVHRDVCHTCDTRLCCNPAHLVNESRSWNMKDAVKKGRISQLILDKIEQGKPTKALREMKAREKAKRIMLGTEPEPRLRDSMGRMIKRGQVLPPRERDERGFFV